MNAVLQQHLLEAVKASVNGQLLVDGFIVHMLDDREEGRQLLVCEGQVLHSILHSGSQAATCGAGRLHNAIYLSLSKSLPI